MSKNTTQGIGEPNHQQEHNEQEEGQEKATLNAVRKEKWEIQR